ncbi:VirB4 family type IV secretion system protein [Myxococcota bacterium]
MTGRAESFAKRLPWWATRTVDISSGESLACLISKDGSIAAGLQVRGLDVYCSENAELNGVARGLRDVLNALPANGYLQAIFETGGSFKPLLRAYANLDTQTRAHPIMGEARLRRIKMLARDTSLSRTRIVYWVGLRRALGNLLSHLSKPTRLRFFGTSKHPSEVTGNMVRRASEELFALVNQIVDLLRGVGIRASVFDEMDIAAECHRAINPSSSKLVGPPILVESRDDLVRLEPRERALFRGPSLASQLPLGFVDAQSDHLSIDDPPTLVRMLTLQRFPFATTPDTLFPLMYKHMPDVPSRIVATHLATDRQLKKEQLERKRNLVQAQMATKTVDHQAVAAYKDYEGLLEQLATSDSRVFGSRISVAVSARHLGELDKATQKLKRAAAEAGGALVTMRNLQLVGWLETLPGVGASARPPYPLLTENCAHLMPYFQPSIGEDDAPDFLFGTRQRSLRAVSWRQTGSKDNANTFVVGATGSGKTFYFSHILKATLWLGGHIVLADIKGPVNSTYRPMTELLGGQYVALSAIDERISLNPCPEQHVARQDDGTLGEAAEYLRDIVCLMAVPDFDQSRDKDLYKRVAWDAIVEAYDQTKALTRPPILSDIVCALKGVKPKDEELVPLARDMALRLNLWCEDRRRSALLNRPTAMASDNPFQVFDFFGLGDDPDLAAVLISTLAARIYAKMQTLPLSTPKVFAFDEAWAFFDHSELAAGLVGGLFRVARSYGAACFVLSQSYKDVSESRAATAMMANASIYVLNRHNAEHDKVADVFDLSSRQLELFRTLELRKGEYAEQLYIDRHNNDAAVLRYAPTPFELWIDSSRAIDLELRSLVMARVGDPLEAIKYLADQYPRGGTPEALEREREIAA